MVEKPVCYLCVARLDGIDRYFFWESGDDTRDRVVLDNDGLILAFPSERIARETGSVCGLAVSSRPSSVCSFWGWPSFERGCVDRVATAASVRDRAASGAPARGCRSESEAEARNETRRSP